MEPDDQVSTEELGESHTSASDKKNVVGWLVLGLLVVVVGVASFFYFNVEEQERDPFADLSGSIYLSMVENGQVFMGLYVFDIAANKLNKIIADDIFFKHTGHLSPDGSKITYTGAPRDRGPRDTRTIEETIQVYVRDLKSGTHEPITESFSIGKRLARWSPDGTQIAYMAYSDEEGNDKPDPEPNAWNIHIVGLDGVGTLVSQGVQPKWSPDGSQLLFLKNDGLYIYNLRDGSITKGIDLGSIKRNTKYDISKDGSILAMTWTQTRDLILYEISSWEPFKAAIIRRIAYSDNTTGAAWPVFSPDDRYLAVQFNNSRTGIPRVDVYELENFMRKELIDLSNYKWDFSFVTDWR